MKYLDDVKNGDQLRRLPVRGSSVQVDPRPPVTLFDANGVQMPSYARELVDEFGHRALDEVLARDIAAACRRDYPGPG